MFDDVTWAGDGDFRQTGQVPFIRSHSSTQSAWKQCLHSGIILSVSLLLYSDKHIAQVLPLGPGSRLLSPRTSLSNDSMVDSSRPITRMVGRGDTVAVAVFLCVLDTALLRACQIIRYAEIAIPHAHKRTGIPIDTKRIPTWRLLPETTCCQYLIQIIDVLNLEFFFDDPRVSFCPVK
jgi:hypothetical protein